MTTGILIAGFDFGGAHADEFHDWYDLEHLPERRAVAGFSLCERWLGADDAVQSIATYDLTSIGVLDSAAYRAIAYQNLSPWSRRVTSMCRRLIRFEGELMTSDAVTVTAGAGGMLLNAMDVAPEGEDEFNAWYDQEHIPALAAVPGTIAARRFRAAAGRTSTHQYVAIYHLESPEVTRSAAWRDAVETPWTQQVRPYFQNRLRMLTGRYTRAE